MVTFFRGAEEEEEEEEEATGVVTPKGGRTLIHRR